jgi:membrane protein implicated in regulation of membrane protease activity
MPTKLAAAGKGYIMADKAEDVPPGLHLSDKPILWGGVGLIIPWFVIIPGFHALMWVTPFITRRVPNQTAVNLLFFAVLSGLFFLIGADATRNRPKSQSTFQNVYVFSLCAVLYVLISLSKI